MKVILIILTLFSITTAAFTQEQFPDFREEALITTDSIDFSDHAEYKLLVYGAIGCSYSRYLVENLNVFDDCGNLEVIILLNDPEEAILREYSSILHKYKVYSNTILEHSLPKNNDITPQTFLFHSDEELLHIKGVKKKMFVKINDQINCK
jgi:hypothetical protein